MKPALRLFGLIFIIYATFFLLKFLQDAFDQGDLRRAREAFNRVLVADQTLWQAMAQDLRVAVPDVQCDELLVSRYEGPVRFECFVKNEKERVFVWNVDVVGFRVTPGNELAQDLMSGLVKE